MTAPDRFTLEDLGAIPDPAPGIAQRPAPAAAAPAEASPTRAGRRRRNGAAIVAAVLWVVAVAWCFGPRGNLGDAGVIAVTGLWTALAASALALGLRPDRRGMPPGLRALQVILASLALLYLVSVLVRATSSPELPLRWNTVRGCLSVANLMALGPILVAVLCLRRSFLSAPGWRGAVVGAVCGLGGAIGVHAHCAVESASHVLVAHGLAIVCGALAGGLFGVVRGRI